jgi:hypothetical protein
LNSGREGILQGSLFGLNNIVLEDRGLSVDDDLLKSPLADSAANEDTTR